MQSILGNNRKADIVFLSFGMIDITPVYGRYEVIVYRSNVRENHFRIWLKALCNAVLKEC